MLLQTNTYIVPKDKRTEHARLVKRFRQAMARLGLTDFEVYEQAGPNWSMEVGGRFVQIMKFRDRDHQRAVREAEQADASAQDLVREFCELVSFGYQQQQGIATTSYYLTAGSNVHAITGSVSAAAPVNGKDGDVELDSDRGEGLEKPPTEEDPFHSAGTQRAAANRQIDD